MPPKIMEYYFKEGCYIEEWLNDDTDPELSIARVRVEPRQTTHLHALHDTVERYVILHGKARVTVGDDSWLVEQKDVVIIPAGVAQKIHNTEDDSLLFLALCTPRFRESNYVDLEPEADL